MYGLKWSFANFMQKIWPLITSHPNNVIDYATTKFPIEVNYADRRRRGEVPEIPVVWAPGSSERNGEETRTFRLYGPLGVKGNTHFGSVQCRVTGDREGEKDRATAGSWGFGRSVEEVQAGLQAHTTPGNLEEGNGEAERDDEANSMEPANLGAVAGDGQAPPIRRGPDPLGLGIPGAVKIITYQTLTHTLKTTLTGNYSGVC
jgi:hypothetical protein